MSWPTIYDLRAGVREDGVIRFYVGRTTLATVGLGSRSLTLYTGPTAAAYRAALGHPDFVAIMDHLWPAEAEDQPNISS